MLYMKAQAWNARFLASLVDVQRALELIEELGCEAVRGLQNACYAFKRVAVHLKRKVIRTATKCPQLDETSGLHDRTLRILRRRMSFQTNLHAMSLT